MRSTNDSIYRNQPNHSCDADNGADAGRELLAVIVALGAMFGVIGLFGLIRVTAGFDSYGLLATVMILALSVGAFFVGASAISGGPASTTCDYTLGKPAPLPPKFEIAYSPNLPHRDCPHCKGCGKQWLTLAQQAGVMQTNCSRCEGYGKC